MCKALKSYLVRELLFGCVVAGMFAIAHAESPQLTAETLPAARREAAARKRRVIMNNDGNDSRTAPSKDRAGFLQSRSVPLAGSQVDAIFYCTGIWGSVRTKAIRSGPRIWRMTAARMHWERLWISDTGTAWRCSGPCA